MRSLILMVLASACWFISPASADSKYEILFDGSTLNGWDGHDEFWSVKNGSIVGRRPLKCRRMEIRF